jgi:hypothetical protein
MPVGPWATWAPWGLGLGACGAWGLGLGQQRGMGHGTQATGCEGGGATQNKPTDPPRVHLLNPGPTHPPSELSFSLAFFLSAFLGVSRKGKFKNTMKIFLQKVHVENLFRNFDKNFDVSFSLTSLVLSFLRVFFNDGSSKTLQKKFCKTILSKSFHKKIDQKSKTDFFIDFF